MAKTLNKQTMIIKRIIYGFIFTIIMIVWHLIVYLILIFCSKKKFLEIYKNAMGRAIDTIDNLNENIKNT